MALGYLVLAQSDEALAYYKELYEKRLDTLKDSGHDFLLDHIIHLEQERLFICFFPLDFEMHELPRIIDRKTVEQLIFGIPAQNMRDFVRSCTVNLLGYRPQKRATTTSLPVWPSYCATCVRPGPTCS